MPNNRIFYAVQQVGIAEMDTTTYVPVHGVQSVSMTTNFNLEQVFELGQIDLYENYEALPDVECTIEKALDGYPLVYALASSGAPSATLAGRSAERSVVAISIFDDTKDAASGNALTTCQLSGMYVQSLTYTLPVEGFCTESVTLVGNNKQWKQSGLWSGQFTNTDSPLAGAVQRRQHVSMADSRWPTNLPGISSSGTNDGSATAYNAHLQNVSISTNLGRDNLLELGRRGPYFRFVTFPVEVTCSIDITSSSGDMISALESATNLSNQTIFVQLSDGTKFDLGTKNKLQSVSETGGDATGGNVITTYNYSNYNFLTVTSPA